MRSVIKSSARSTPVAIFLSLVLAGEALAATWSPASPLTSSGIAFPRGLGTDGAGTAVALYMEHTDDMPDVGFAYRLKVRRSTNMGSTWAPPMTLAESTINADIAMRGNIVDVVWDQGISGRIKYRRSFDGGMTFQPGVLLSPPNKSAWNPSVARGPDGLVVVAWENLNTGVLRVRVSTNGGDTFGPEIPLANVPYDMGNEVAVGNGVIYVGYVADDFNTLLVERSTNDGMTWSAPMPINTNLYSVREMFSLTAAGSRAYIAYTVDSGSGGGSEIKYRRTTNKGASWASQAALSPTTWSSWEPSIAVQGGVLRAAFTRRTSPQRVIYRQSTDGVSWSASELVNAGAFAAEVGFAGKSVVIFRNATGSGDNVFASNRTP